jgi:hypothetical protein
MSELVKLFKELIGKPAKTNSSIGLRSYHYVYESGHEGDAPLGSSPRKSEMVLYIPRFDDEPWSAAQTQGRGCLYVKTLDDIDLGTLKKLATKGIAALRKRYPD